MSRAAAMQLARCSYPAIPLQSGVTYPLSCSLSKLLSEGDTVEDRRRTIPSGSPAGGKVKRCDLSTYTCPAENQDGDCDLSVKNVLTAPDPKRKKYVHESIGPFAEAFQVEELEKQIRCLTITTEDKHMRAVSQHIEEAYAQGHPLTPPEIEFSEDNDVEDNYWTWDQETQHFKHWDEELEEWVSFPERFD
ncbi:hypothetical protein FHETE_2892 [Fusarium heterosporum]|uniref:Uncharacterized protein n=1 Tax=Fusarium heterosporum TaxID=42747 RepID=A0A8H5WXE4_FUSHE|nr:hypothetical protein FHETE_2892 [Fusarium heterosporum]